MKRTYLSNKQQKIIFGLYIHSWERLTEEEFSVIAVALTNIAGEDWEMFFDFLCEDKSIYEFKTFYGLRSLTKLYRWKKQFYEFVAECFGIPK